uniref:BRCT domain-containing protein n=1 Tax=Arundo donax TaxID=35708 RepID=A0A0A9AF55_ARUDO
MFLSSFAFFFGSILFKQLYKMIIDRGGLVLSLTRHDMCTHVCVEGETSNIMNKIITSDWIKECCERNKKLDLIAPSERAKLLSVSSNGKNVRRMLGFFEEEDNELHMKLHDLIFCSSDFSNRINLRQYVEQLKDLVLSLITPGGEGYNHKSVVTAIEVKVLLKEIYILLKTLHELGYCLRGRSTWRTS